MFEQIIHFPSWYVQKTSVQHIAEAQHCSVVFKQEYMLEEVNSWFVKQAMSRFVG